GHGHAQERPPVRPPREPGQGPAQEPAERGRAGGQVPRLRRAGAVRRARRVGAGRRPDSRDRPRRETARADAGRHLTLMPDGLLLEGVRVIVEASCIAGPVATTILADLGAEVIKIEPPQGDPYRNRMGGPGIPESPHNYRWIVDNRTKRGLALDLRPPAG